MKRSGWILLALCVLACGWPSATAEALDADWTACAQAQDQDRSIRACTEILARGNAKNPRKRAGAYMNRGTTYALMRDYDRAIADLDQAIRLDTRYSKAYTNRGAVYDKKGDYERAIADLDQAIRLNPKNTDAFGNRGVVYDRKGDYDRAIADYDQAIRLDPKDANVLVNRGVVFKRRGDAARARADFEAALAARPGDQRATAGLARLAKPAPAPTPSKLPFP
jgi:tetratricopeptide (TPR) repeat protein